MLPVEETREAFVHVIFANSKCMCQQQPYITILLHIWKTVLADMINPHVHVQKLHLQLKTAMQEPESGTIPSCMFMHLHAFVMCSVRV